MFVKKSAARFLQPPQPGKGKLKIIPLTLADRIDTPGTFEGTGDHVFIIQGDPSRANITGNAASRHFAVIGWGTSGSDLLVNTTDPYEGTVLLDSGTLIIEVIAEGPWTIEFP